MFQGAPRVRIWIPAAMLAVAPILQHAGGPEPHSGSRLVLEEEEEGLSGAMQALNLWAAERTYPNRILPDAGQMPAFRQVTLMRTADATSTSPVDGLVPPWTSLGPANIGGRTLSLALRPGDPDVIFAGSASGGLWRSTTGGVGADAWDRVETGFPVQAVGAIAIDPRNPDVMYIGTGEVYQYRQADGGDVNRYTRGSYGIGILKSVNGGATWSRSLDWSLLQNRGVWSIRIDPQDSDVLYAATTEGVYRSLDAGGSWTRVLDVIMATDLAVHPAHPDTVFATCGDYGSPGTGIYRSVDAGDTWSRLVAGLPVTWSGKAMLDIAPSSPNVVYASIADIGGGVGLFRSNDGGGTWSLVNDTDYPAWQGWYSHWVLADAADPDTILAGGIDIWKSTDGGVTLNKVSDWTTIYLGTPAPGEPGGGPLYAHADQHVAVRHPDDPHTVFFGSDGGVFKTTDAGSTFTGLNGGYVTSQFYQGFSNSGLTANFAMGGMQDNLTAIYEGSVAWRRVIGGDGCWTAVNPQSNNILYGSAQGLTLFRSRDGGENWTEITPPRQSGDLTAFVAPFVLSPSNPGRIYAGRARVYRSGNEGTTWTGTNGNRPLDGNPVFSLVVSPTDPDLVFAATAPTVSRGRIFRTRDGGLVWEDVTGTLPDRWPGDLALDPTDNRRVFVTLMGFGTSHVFASFDQGDSWVDIGEGLPDVPTSAVVADGDHPGTIYVGTDLGVFVSPFYGRGWFPFIEGMPVASVDDLTISGPAGKLRAATHGNGVYERDLLNLPITATPGGDAAGVLALRVAPNPLRTDSRVTFRLAAPAHVRLDLYDVSGRRLARLMDRTQGPGEHSVPLAPADLASGIYFLKLEAGGVGAVTRVTLLR